MSDVLTKQQKYQRLKSLSNLARERYLASGGNPRKSADGNIHLTEVEQQEFITIATELSTPLPQSK